MEVIPFEKATFSSSSLIATFFNAIDEKIYPEYQLNSMKNVSPRGEFFKASFFFYQLYGAGLLERKDLEACCSIVRRMPKEIWPQYSVNILTPEQQRHFIEINQGEYEEIANRFVPESNGVLFHDSVVIDEKGGDMSMTSENLFLASFVLQKTNLRKIERLEQKMLRNQLRRFWGKMKLRLGMK
ncbi:hypothetical protein [Pseudodesulfovibrio tunisiensis]|uniref:hypothetical protein n=1 Tax=Pseudodesulfovibrio tunisiensis TaxID=463192 RepID=UPI001FB4ED71|nr:hypothetical protein [Pseudodesulfovibrio tunisiensis]